jgi:hypothetical protein
MEFLADRQVSHRLNTLQKHDKKQVFCNNSSDEVVHDSTFTQRPEQLVFMSCHADSSAMQESDS